MDKQTLQLVSQHLPNLRQTQISAALKLMDEGNTIPFIARYRKEVTGTLDEVQLQSIRDEYHHVTNLLERKETVINKIAEQGKMTPSLEKQIRNANELQEVEDLYLPYKQKRQTKAQKARAAGLEPLASWLLTYPADDLEAEAAKYTNAEVEDAQAALNGAHEILAEAISEMATVRGWLRSFVANHGQLQTKVKRGGEDKDELGTYKQYYDFTAPIKELNSYQVLAINRGEKEKVLNVKVTVDDDAVFNYLHFRLIRTNKQNAATAFIEEAYRDAYKRFLAPSIEREIRRQLTRPGRHPSHQGLRRQPLSPPDAGSDQGQDRDGL